MQRFRIIIDNRSINSNGDGKKPGVTPASRNRQISEARLIRKGIRDLWIIGVFSSLVTYLRGNEKDSQA